MPAAAERGFPVSIVLAALLGFAVGDAFRPAAEQTSAKAGVAAMTVVWAKELARYGIRSAAIAPGFCATEILSAMKAEMVDRVKAAVPLRRLGEPAEIAATAVFIAENDFVTGRVIEVDGGLRL